MSNALGTKTVDQSGWHVYANMEHVNRHLKEIGQPCGKGAYPRTDDILRRAMNISIGVVDGGLGAAFGINIDSDDEDIAAAAATVPPGMQGIAADGCQRRRVAKASWRRPRASAPARVR